MRADFDLGVDVDARPLLVENAVDRDRRTALRCVGRGNREIVGIEKSGQVGRGRLLPSTSVDEYSATLARWFGVSDSEMPSVAPNIGRFATPDLGFMAAS